MAGYLPVLQVVVSNTRHLQSSPRTFRHSSLSSSPDPILHRLRHTASGSIEILKSRLSVMHTLTRLLIQKLAPSGRGLLALSVDRVQLTLSYRQVPNFGSGWPFNSSKNGVQGCDLVMEPAGEEAKLSLISKEQPRVVLCSFPSCGTFLLLSCSAPSHVLTGVTSAAGLVL